MTRKADGIPPPLMQAQPPDNSGGRSWAENPKTNKTEVHKMNEIKSYPVQPDEYTKEEAPYLYTAYAEAYAAARPRLEPRPAGTIACFAGQPLQHGTTARAWLKAGYVVKR